MTLLYGLITGIIFGFLLQKGRVIRYDKQLGALRLMDMTIVKFMLSTILVAMVGTYLLKDFGLIKLSIKPTILGAVILGGLIFGIGWVFWATVLERRLVLWVRPAGMRSGEFSGCLAAPPFMLRLIPL